MTIDEIVLGPEGLNYLREQLEYGRRLSQRLLVLIERRGGRVRTWLPSDVEQRARVSLNHGGVFRVGASYSYLDNEGDTKPDRILVDLLLRFLNEGKNAVVIFEDTVAEASDPGLSELESRFLRMDDDVYHVLEHRDADRQVIEKTVREARSASGFLAGLSESSKLLPARQGERLLESDLDDLVSHCVGIICDAYDGESFIIWTAD